MKTLIIACGVIFAWLILSQVIAWMITPSQDEDEVVQSWFVVFMLPAILPIIGIMILESYWRKLADVFWFPDVFGLFGGE